MNTAVLLPCLVAALVSGCFLAKKSAQPQDPAASMAPQCEATAAKLQSACEEAPAEASSALSAHLERQRAALAPHCSDPSVEPAFAKLDQCLASLHTRGQAEQEEALARQEAVKDKVPYVKADQKYQDTLATWQAQVDDTNLACDDAEDRRRARMDNAATAQRKCDRLSEQLRETEAQMRAILESHGIDPRDAPALGLW